MTYAAVAAGGRAVQQPAAAAADVPARLLPQLHPCAVLIDIHAVWRDAGREERSSFVLKALAVPAADVSGIYVVPETQLLRVNFESKVTYLEALAKLRRGVPWPERGGQPVYGWAASDTVAKVRICGVPEHLRMGWLKEHLGQFGQVLLALRGGDPDFPAAFDGVVYVTLILRRVWPFLISSGWLTPGVLPVIYCWSIGTMASATATYVAKLAMLASSAS